MNSWASLGVRLVARGAVLYAFWLLLVDDLHPDELVTGAVTAGGAAALGTIVDASRRDRVLVTLPMLRRLYRPLLKLVTDTFTVTGALLRAIVWRQPVQGRLRAVRYEAVSDRPQDRGRRILTEWGASLAANRYALGIDRESRYLLVHELAPSSEPLDPLGLG